MNRASATLNTSQQSQQAQAAETFQHQGVQIQQNELGSSVGNVFDLTRVPVRPGLQTGPRVQCCARDGGGCSCPKCQEAAGMEENGGGGDGEQSTTDTEPAEQSAVSEAAPEQSETQENASSVESPEASTESGVVAEAPAAGLIVEDSVEGLQEGQMKKMQFLQALRESICSTIGPVLATVGQTTDGCPYLNYWFDLYQGKDAAQVERTIRRYAPDSASARTAEEYISIVAQRALQAAETWASTGNLSGVPDGVPTTLPNEAPAQEASGDAGKGGIVQAKAKSGGVKKADDPRAIRQELGEGQPLASDVRGRMESAFGMNFSNVRTHTDATAMEVSSRVNARAFTVGDHMAFGGGEYQPGTMMGDALIAHELAHTIQQGGSEGSMDEGSESSVDKMEIGDAGYHALEQDADGTAVGVMSRLWGGEKEGMKGAVQRSIPLLRSGLKLQRCGGGGNINDRENPCTTRAAPPTPVKTVTVRPTYLWGGSTSGKFTSQLTYANRVYAPAGIAISAGSDMTINETDTKAILGTNALLNDSSGAPRLGSYTAEETALFTRNSAANEVTDYYIKGLENTTSLWGLSYVDSGKFVQDPTTTDRVMAHELGHLLVSLGHPPTNNDNIMAQSSRATGVDCLSDDQIDAARASNLAR